MTNRNAQAYVHSGNGLTTVVHSTKSLQQPVPCTHAVNSVTTSSTAKTQLPRVSIKPLLPSVTASTYNRTSVTCQNGELLVISAL